MPIYFQHQATAVIFKSSAGWKVMTEVSADVYMANKFTDIPLGQQR